MQSVAEGETLKEFAHHHDVTYETARSHIRRILDKTGARRQSELVGLFHKLR